MDINNKQWWVIHGENLERAFVKDICPKIGLDARINPDKKVNCYAPDLIINGKLSELKCVMTPFYTAGRKVSHWGRRSNPMTTVTFDRKDYILYKEHYPRIQIYFWVSWLDNQFTAANGKVIEVKSLSGVWHTPFKALSVGIEIGRYPHHEYLGRVDDTRGNSKSCYLIDLRDLNRVAIFNEREGIKVTGVGNGI